ncbi:ROK family transcriptional regulator [Streptomyces sp. NPDC047108]|uniref:ROK family transcriptional regulator n=1 Tax=Streptomyces sp. NPDC047108 TaxID=3155025 RepID=UPI0034055321
MTGTPRSGPAAGAPGREQPRQEPASDASGISRTPRPPTARPVPDARRTPHTQHGIRQRNLSLVLHTVAAEGPLSRADVAGRVGLTRAAVSTLVDELTSAGLLVELGRGRPGTVGRPGSALVIGDHGPAGLGAEIGVDHLAVCAVDLRGRVRVRVEEPVAGRGSDPATVLARLAELVRAVTAEAESEGLRPRGLAVAVPGLVARDSATVVHAPNLGWQGVDAGPALQAAVPPGVPVSVGNEADFGALAELLLGEGGASRRDFVHISAEIGIGAAVVVDGALLRGAQGFAGELGHVPVRPEGPACPCGGRGCLEQYAGEEAVRRAAGLRDGEGIAELQERAAAGEEAVLRALDEAGTALGIALAGVVNLLDPQAVVLGGALAGLSPWLLPAAQRELTGRVIRPYGGITVSRVGRDGPLLGAAHSVVQAVLDDPLGRAGSRGGGSG